MLRLSLMVVEFVADSLPDVLRSIFLLLLFIFLVDLLSDRQLEGLVQDGVDPAATLHLN